MSQRNEFFTIELKIKDRSKAADFLEQFTKAMANETPVGDGAFDVIACGWGDQCGSMTACDAYEQELRELGHDPEDIVEEFLINESKMQ